MRLRTEKTAQIGRLLPQKCHFGPHLLRFGSVDRGLFETDFRRITRVPFGQWLYRQ